LIRHRWTGRYEAHLWDKNCWNESQNKKGRQGYILSFLDCNIIHLCKLDYNLMKLYISNIRASFFLGGILIDLHGYDYFSLSRYVDIIDFYMHFKYHMHFLNFFDITFFYMKENHHTY
jgi:hypothetical protein